MAEERRPPSFEIPDLELEAVRPRRPAQAAAPAPAPAPVALDDDFELESVQSSLGFGLDAQEVSAIPAARGDARDDTPWPTGQAPDPRELEPDFASVEQLAAYGRPPESLFASPFYAFKVYRRRRELRQGHSDARLRLGEAEAARDRALSTLVQSSRRELEGERFLAHLLARLKDAELRAQDHGRALQSLNAEITSQLAGIDAEIAGVKTEIEALEREAGERRAELELLEANLKRAEARVKRVEIEIRAVRDAAARRAPVNANGAAGAVQLSQEEAARVAELSGRTGELEREVAAARAPVQAARAELEGLEREQRARGQRVREHERRKHAFVRAARGRLNQQGETAERAASETLEVEIELGRELLKARGRIPVVPEMLATLRAADGEVLAAARDHELSSRAVNAFDRQRARQGLVVTGASLLGLVALLAWLLA